MPPSALELEIDSVTRWLSDTFPGAEIMMQSVPNGFQRPAFLLEPSRTSEPPMLPAVRGRQTAVPITYFGALDPQSRGQWSPIAVQGAIETALDESRHRIPRRDADGNQAGLLIVTVDMTALAAEPYTGLSITLRYTRLVADRQPELEGEVVDEINFRQV